MKEEFKEALRGWLAAHWQEDRGQCLGLLAGITLAIMILLIGFWRTAFIVLCGGVGLYIGRKADRVPCTSCATNARSCALIAPASPSAVSMASVSCISS